VCEKYGLSRTEAFYAKGEAALINKDIHFMKMVRRGDHPQGVEHGSSMRGVTGRNVHVATTNDTIRISEG